MRFELSCKGHLSQRYNCKKSNGDEFVEEEHRHDGTSVNSLHVYAFTPLPTRVLLGPRKKIKGWLKILWDKNVKSQSPLHSVENRMLIGLQVASESSSEGMLSVCLSVCINAPL